MDIISWANAPDGPLDPGEILARADALRDARDWPAAATAYAAYLALRPEAWAIRVQYGHSLKEAGDPHGALLSYREAERQNPEDADIHLQIGHALKLMDRHEEALEEYARALTLDPACTDALNEVMALNAGLPPAAAPAAYAPPVQAPPIQAPPVQAPAVPATSLDFGAAPAAAIHPAPRAVLAWPAASGLGLVFDASDLFDYFRNNRMPTGIQRVQLAIIGEAIAGPDADRITIAAFAAGEGVWKDVPQALFRRLAALARDGAAVADAGWRAVLAALADQLRDAPPLALAEGCSLVNLGTSWWIPDYMRVVREAKARHRIRYIPFIHDCIPLLVPEHCAAGLVDEFARWFAAVCLHADAVLTNSDCTRADFLRLQQRLLPGLAIPCFSVPLDAADLAGPAGPLPPMLRAGRPYVLFVGTIESRKNHLLAFGAWLTLLRRHGADAVPDLVCVGKRGWLADAALKLHHNSAVLRAKVHLLHGVPDPELAGLYRGCLFTLYNSFYEGWGLPVSESLAHGKVPLVPDHSSLRQAGGPGAVYFAPQSEPDLVAALERLIFDPGFRIAQEAVVAAGPRPRRWADVAAQVQDLVREAGREAGRGGLPAPLDRLAFRFGEVHPLRLLPGPEPSLAMAVADMLRDGDGWSRLEAWGVWTLPGQAVLRLPLEPGAAAGRLRVYLELVAPPHPVECRIRAGLRGGAAGPALAIEAAGQEVLFCTLDVVAEAGGEIEVTIETEHGAALPAAPGGETRQVGIGVKSVMVCRREDIAARLDYLERAALPRLVAG